MRDEPADAGSAPEIHGNRRDSARRVRPRAGPRRRARGGRNQPGSGAARRLQGISRGPVLPTERHRNHDPAATSARRRHSRAARAFSASIRRSAGDRAAGRCGRRHEGPRRFRVAGQRSPAQECRRAADREGPARDHHLGGSSAGGHRPTAAVTGRTRLRRASCDRGRVRPHGQTSRIVLVGRLPGVHDPRHHSQRSPVHCPARAPGDVGQL